MLNHQQAPTTKLIPLLESQNGIILSWIQNPELTQYNVCFSHTLDKGIDIQRLQDAMMRTAERHDIYKTRIVQQENGFFQYIDPQISFSVKITSMSEAEYNQYKKAFLRPFNLLEDVLIRMEIVKTETTVYAMVDMHHVIADGYTLTRFWNDVDEIYQGRTPENDDQLELAVEREQASFKSPEYELTKQYCQKTFSGLDITHVPTQNPQAIGILRSVIAFVPKTLVDTFSKAHHISPNMLFMTAYAYALSIFSGEENVVLDALYHGRSDNDTARTLGMFIKNLPVRFDFGKHQSSTIREVVDDLTEQFHQLRKGIYPYTHFAKDLGISSNNTFTFQNWFEPVVINGVIRKSDHIQEGGDAEFISVLIYPYENDYKIIVEYNDGRYQKWLMDQFIGCMADMAVNIIRHPETMLSQMSLLSAQKKADILKQSEGEKIEIAPDFIDAFRQQAQTTPDAIAVVDKTSSITYGQLDAASDQIANSLTDSGIGRHDMVAMLMPRTKEYIISILGILKIGAIFVPIDSDYPQQRVDYILHHSKAKMLLNQQRVEEMLSRQSNGEHQTVAVEPSDIAYMIYTSGSTGTPKGVMIPRRALNTFVSTCVHTYQLSAADRIFCHSSFNFDASIEDLFPILTCGGQLHIPDEAMRKDVVSIRQYIIDHKITGGNYTTAFGEFLLTTFPDLPVRYVTLGGERLDKIPPGVACRFFNSYGPTEFTVDATFWEKPDGFNSHVVPIGRPVCNCRAYVLDAHQRLLPNGCNGELYLSGPQVAAGYWDNPELTAEKFQKDPFSPLDKMYRTGDIVRWNEDGQLEYVGRNDSQVKLRGFRIELGEAETILSHLADITQVVAKVMTIHGRQGLCVWYTTRSGKEVKDIRHLAKEAMPTFMIPDAFIHLQEFPVMPNGKIDQKALTITETDSEHRSKTSPCSNSEQLMVSIVEEMTGTDNISVTDDLFHDIGLSSLQAIRLAFLAKAKGLDVNVTSLYEQRSIRAVFQHAEKRCSSYWADGEYDPAKPVAILICGYVYVHPLYDNFVDYFRKYFSIYIFDAFHENFMWKEQISCDILMDEYMDAFRKEVLGKPLNLIMGTCYGADLAIPFAERVRQETGMAHRVLAMDPFYARRDLIEETPYEMNPNEAILEQYRISDTLQKTVPLPTYDGPMIIVAPTDTTNQKYPEYDNVFMTEEEMEAVKQFLLRNEEDWETHFPQVPKYKVPLDHYRFLETPNLPRIDEILTTHWPDIYMCKKMQK